MKKITFFIAISLLVIVTNYIHAQGYEWVSGSVPNDNNSLGCNSISMDKNGNSYVTGAFSTSVDFGTTNLVSNGGTDIYIAKIDSNGVFLWAKSIGDVYDDRGNHIAVDSAGNIYVTGTFMTTLTPFMFDTIPVFPGNNYFSMFVAKFSSDGNIKWVKASNNSNGFGGNVSAITTDQFGNAFVTGSTNGQLIFDGNIIGTSYTSQNTFIIKLDSLGVFQWGTMTIGDYESHSNSIAVDESSNCFVTGNITGLTVFDSDTINTYGSGDIFLAKYNISGNCIWVKHAGGSYNDESNEISLDNNGNLFITGYYQFNVVDTLFFDSITFICQPQMRDMFLAKYDTSGTIKWVVRADGEYDQYPSSVACDSYGNAYITGHYRGLTYFGSDSLNSYNWFNNDFFAAKYDINGNYEWVRIAQGAGNEGCNEIALFNGNVFIVGGASPGIINNIVQPEIVTFGDIIKDYSFSSNIFIAKINSSITCQASFIYNADTTVYPYQYVFSNSSTSNISNYYWDFGDGTTSIIENPVHVFPNNGSFNVCLIVDDTLNHCSDTLCRIVDVVMVDCMALFSADTIAGSFSNYQFTDLSGGDIINWFWDFGNGDTSNVQNPIYSFPGSGGYNVCLTINTPTCTDTICSLITVPIICHANFCLDTLNMPCGTNCIPFLDVSSGNSISWYWDFGDGTFSNVQNPIHVYLDSGSYNVCLTITNNDTINPCTNTYCDTVSVDSVLNCALDVTYIINDVTTIGGNDGTIDVNVSGGFAPYSYLWSTGAASQDINGLSPGTYTLDISEAETVCPPFHMSFTLYEPYDTTGGPIVDTLMTSAIDTCFGFQVDSFYISHIVVNNDPNIVTVFWIFAGEGQTAAITVDYYWIYSGNNAVMLEVNCAKGSIIYMSYIHIIGSSGIDVQSFSDNQLFIFPNPANDYLKIMFNTTSQYKSSMRIFTVTGQDVYSKTTGFYDGNNIVTVDISRFEHGLYVVQLFTDGIIRTGKFIK
jgi:PKD repeat protein